MTKKRNDALEALGTPRRAEPADVVPLRANAEVPKAPKAPDDVVRVMLYLPHAVKRVFDDMGHTAERRPHEFYVKAIEQYLRENGHGVVADLLIRR